MRRALVLVFLVAAVVAGSKLFFENLLGIDISGWLQAQLASAGAGSALVVIGLLAVDLFLPVPSSLVMILSGAAFGVWWGGLLALVGSIGGEWMGFELVRRYGKRASRRIVSDDDLEWLSRMFATHGAAAVVVSRALPILMETMSVVAGFSTMSRAMFLWTSLLGTAPIVFVYAYAGAASRQAGSLVPAVVMTIAIAGGAAVWFFSRRDRLERR